MLNDLEFNKLLNETIYYYEPEDIMIPLDNQKHNADLIGIGSKEFWIPHSVSKFTQLINLNTGELFTGYVIKRRFLNTDKNKPKRKNWLRKRADLEYDHSGKYVKLKNGWSTYSPEVFK